MAVKDITSENPTKSLESIDINNSDATIMQICYPNIGVHHKTEILKEIKKKYVKIDADKAEPFWTEHYDASFSVCSHVYLNGTCKNLKARQECEVIHF